MRYKKITIKNYRAITNEIEINIEKNSLTPIIGINESGKTTILQAIFAFDKFNDSLNNGNHLKDTNNLYDTDRKAPMISAELEMSQSEYDEIIGNLLKDDQNDLYEFSLNKYKKVRIDNNSFKIKRNLHTKGYIIEDSQFTDRKLNNIVSYHIVSKLPYLFYFDDFRDSIEDKIEIKTDEDDIIPGWLSIIEEMFKQTSQDYSVFKLKEYELRQRKSIISKVQKRLNRTLTEEWQNFRLDDSDALKIDIGYEQEGDQEFIKLEVIETDSNGDEHFFYIRDRSKGFYWFFNFVMKLEFNPKSIGPDGYNSIYLLDEPGSYLHASAQTKLAKKLQQISRDNKVIYCTHSHYLLNPDIIPISSIRIADKDSSGNINLLSIGDYKGNISDRKSAFQPILDSLQIKPLIYDLSNEQILIAEGIYDYYCFELFKGTRSFKSLPGVGADSLKFYISLLILSQKDYRVIWDNDPEGISALEKATNFFGDVEASKFFLLSKNKKKTILQDIFDGEEYKELKTRLSLPRNCSFNKVILKFYFSSDRENILSELKKTQSKFDVIFNRIGLL